MSQGATLQNQSVRQNDITDAVADVRWAQGIGVVPGSEKAREYASFKDQRSSDILGILEIVHVLI
jgi:hypothetical protein